MGSLVTIHPSRHPGTTHLLEMEPNVSTGATEPNTPMGTNLFFPNVKCAYTSSAMTKMPSFLAVSATYIYIEQKTSKSSQHFYIIFLQFEDDPSRQIGSWLALARCS
jgi:hypothetical protein